MLAGASLSSNLGLLDIFRGEFLGEIFGELAGDNLPELEDRFGFTFADILNCCTELGRHSRISVSQAFTVFLFLLYKEMLIAILIFSFTVLTKKI